ncbi:hypothetical protein SVIOM74S_07882 [Streptomyces violarus]
MWLGEQLAPGAGRLEREEGERAVVAEGVGVGRGGALRTGGDGGRGGRGGLLAGQLRREARGEGGAMGGAAGRVVLVRGGGLDGRHGRYGCRGQVR